MDDNNAEVLEYLEHCQNYIYPRLLVHQDYFDENERMEEFDDYLLSLNLN